MEELYEKLMGMGMEQFVENTRQELIQSDETILKDIEDEESLEQRYESLDLEKEQRMLINDYISCMKSADSRHSDISYIAGIKDTVRMLAFMGMLKGDKAS